MKARGIARDLFGTEDGHVLPVQVLDDPDELRKAFVRMMEREDDLKAAYAEKIPAYRERLAHLPGELSALLKRS